MKKMIKNLGEVNISYMFENRTIMRSLFNLLSSNNILVLYCGSKCENWTYVLDQIPVLLLSMCMDF